MRLLQIVGYLAHRETNPTFIVLKMKKTQAHQRHSTSDSTFIKQKPVIAILERTMRLFLRLNSPHFPTIKSLQIQELRTIRLELCLAKSCGKILGADSNTNRINSSTDPPGLFN